MDSDIDFKNIEYLRVGNSKQKQAYRVLTENCIMLVLKEFNPILIGTIPININIENSDLDIICQFVDVNDFEKFILEKFGHADRFRIWRNTSQGTLAIVSNFFVDGFEIEIFGQNMPTNEQRGYRHMLVEYELLKKGGSAFRERIIRLKEDGYKTEPAFAYELGIEGDPYEALLKLDK